MKNYALVKKTDFTDSGTNITLENVEPNDQKPAPKCDAKSDAINDFDAKSDAESSSTDSHEFASNQVKNALPQICLEGQCVPVDDIGLENSAETRELSFFDPKATPNPANRFIIDAIACFVRTTKPLFRDLFL